MAVAEDSLRVHTSASVVVGGSNRFVRWMRGLGWRHLVAWAALIFALSSVPDLNSGLGGWDLVLRKLAHATEYGILGALLAIPIAGSLLAVAREVVNYRRETAAEAS